MKIFYHSPQLFSHAPDVSECADTIIAYPVSGDD